MTNLAAGQCVDLTLKLAIIGVNVPRTNCGAMLQSCTLAGANAHPRELRARQVTSRR